MTKIGPFKILGILFEKNRAATVSMQREDFASLRIRMKTKEAEELRPYLISEEGIFLQIGVEEEG